MMRKNRTKTVALVGMLAALTMVLSAVESALPSLPFPAARLGLANVSVTAATALVSPAAGVCVAAIKVLFVLMTRGVTASWTALVGTAFALTVTILLLPLERRECMTFIGVSVASATAHTLGQLTAASWMLTAAVWSYAPFMLMLSLLTGGVTGLVLNVLIPRLMPLTQNSRE